jgi:hypothetical protein
MAVSDNEKFIIIKKREEIRIVSQEILDLVNKESLSEQDITDIKKKFVHIISLLNIISTSAKSTFDMQKLTKMIATTIEGLESPTSRKTSIIRIEAFCFAVNAFSYSYSHWPTFFKADSPLGGFEIGKK